MGLRLKSKGQLSLAYRLLEEIFPRVDEELSGWDDRAASAPDGELRRQARASIAHKRFHALGGSFYGLNGDRLVRFITAYQTISDYLDNLCDRAGVLDGEAFRCLHGSMLDALSPGAEPRDYYRFYPHREDGGYLEALVRCCQEVLGSLPSYPRVQGEALGLACLYGDLQVYKHLQPEERVPRLQAWYGEKCRCPGEISWWEFASACGSTLGVFALAAASAREGLSQGEARALKEGYFPWVCGLHILLDYYIDQEEDLREGDLNFVAFYGGMEERRERLLLFVKRAMEEAGKLPGPSFHRLAVQGLLAMYLSDPKVRVQGLEAEAGLLVARGGYQARALHALCRMIRRRGLL